jgi:hypothetical protein
MQSPVDAVKPGSESADICQMLQAFPPVYFAMVMIATGIVSIAAYLNGMHLDVTKSDSGKTVP